VVPELPLPEPRGGYAPVPYESPPPAAPAKHVETPEEIAEKRRLSAPLSGSNGGSAVSATGGGAGEGTDRDRGGLDLSVTKTSTAFARRLSDLTFILPKGSYLNCILDTAIQSDQAGLVTCTLPEDVYGADGTVVLLDRGSQVLGEYKSATLTYDKRRIYVVWDRVRTPGGVIVDIASPGTGPLGQAGLGGTIDNHYWELHDILGPIRPILARDDVTDLCINGPGLLFVESARGWERIPADNITGSWLNGFAKAVASWMSATVGERAPILSGHLPTGERIQIVLPPAAEAPSVTAS
jgi:hypothetical protein